MSYDMNKQLSAFFFEKFKLLVVCQAKNYILCKKKHVLTLKEKNNIYNHEIGPKYGPYHTLSISEGKPFHPTVFWSIWQKYSFRLPICHLNLFVSPNLLLIAGWNDYLMEGHIKATFTHIYNSILLNRFFYLRLGNFMWVCKKKYLIAFQLLFQCTWKVK